MGDRPYSQFRNWVRSGDAEALESLPGIAKVRDT